MNKSTLSETEELELKFKTLFLNSMKGDVRAYEQFLILSGGVVKNVLGKIGGKSLSTEYLEDLHQEIILSIHQKKHTYQVDRPILPWIYAITRYRYIDFYRQKKSLPSMVTLEDDLILEQATPSFGLEDLYEHLTSDQQKLIQLIKIEGASYNEAAKALEMSVPSVKISLHRLIKTLKKKVHHEE